MGAGCIEHCDGCAVHNTLRTDIHIGAGGHLTVLRHTHGIHPLPVVGLGVIWYHHAVGHHHTRRAGVGGEQPERMSGVHHQRLAVGHLRQIFHGKAILRPILKHSAVASICNQFVRMLGHCRIKIILNHHHYGGSLAGAGRIILDTTRFHLIMGSEAVHVYASVVLQLPGEFGSELGMHIFGEITQCVAQSQFFLLRRKYILASGSMAHCVVVWPWLGEYGGYPLGHSYLEFLFSHIFCKFFFVWERRPCLILSLNSQSRESPARAYWRVWLFHRPHRRAPRRGCGL